jgi:hypothetical protein
MVSNLVVDKFLFSSNGPVLTLAQAYANFKDLGDDHKISKFAQNVFAFDAFMGLRKGLKRLFRATKLVEGTKEVAVTDIPSLKAASKNNVKTRLAKKVANIFDSFLQTIGLLKDLGLTRLGLSERSSLALGLGTEGLNIAYAVERIKNGQKLIKASSSTIENSTRWLNCQIADLGLSLLKLSRDLFGHKIANKNMKLAVDLSLVFCNYLIFSQRKIIKKTIKNQENMNTK